MFLSDDTLEKILSRFELDEQEKWSAIEALRASQVEIMFKSFLIYYETKKSEIELRYLDKIKEGLENDFPKYIVKFRDLFIAESENNLEMQSFVVERMTNYITDIIRASVEGKDRDYVENIVKSVFENIDVVEAFKNHEQSNDDV